MTRAFSSSKEYQAAVTDPSFDVSTPRNGAVFWSDDSLDGQPMNRLRAENYAKKKQDQGGAAATLEGTAGGKWLDDQKLFEEGSPTSRTEARKVWQDCSKKYADSASGDTRCFVTGSHPNSVFRQIEMPALAQNPNVSTINGIPRQDVADALAKDPAAAFAMVESADTALRAEEMPVGGEVQSVNENQPLDNPSAQTPGQVQAASAGGGGGGGGPLQVVNSTNMIVCTCCPIPQPLTVTSNVKSSVDGNFCATIMDNVPFVNIKPFGPCALTPAPPSPSGGPCIPKPTGPWTPGASKTKHSYIPALRQTDILICGSGGVISVVNPGQFKFFPM